MNLSDMSEKDMALAYAKIKLAEEIKAETDKTEAEKQKVDADAKQQELESVKAEISKYIK
jgi:hypothetical protein